MTTETALIHQAAALVLDYPDATLLARLPTLREAVGATWAASLFAPVLDHLVGDLYQLQAFHVAEFDLSRRHALHLTYWTDGDTRRRGEVLAAIKGVYRASGLVVDTGGELPDYLPMVLEFAVRDPGRGIPLLQRYRPSLELLRLGLADDHLPHAGVLAAVCRTLPGPAPKTRADVHAMVAAIAPVETVGLEPYGSHRTIPEPDEGSSRMGSGGAREYTRIPMPRR